VPIPAASAPRARPAQPVETRGRPFEISGFAVHQQPRPLDDGARVRARANPGSARASHARRPASKRRCEASSARTAVHSIQAATTTSACGCVSRHALLHGGEVAAPQRQPYRGRRAHARCEASTSGDAFDRLQQ
jgi:hypothetical protein